MLHIWNIGGASQGVDAEYVVENIPQHTPKGRADSCELRARKDEHAVRSHPHYTVAATVAGATAKNTIGLRDPLTSGNLLSPTHFP